MLVIGVRPVGELERIMILLEDYRAIPSPELDPSEVKPKAVSLPPIGHGKRLRQTSDKVGKSLTARRVARYLRRFSSKRRASARKAAKKPPRAALPVVPRDSQRWACVLRAEMERHRGDGTPR